MAETGLSTITYKYKHTACALLHVIASSTADHVRIYSNQRLLTLDITDLLLTHIFISKVLVLKNIYTNTTGNTALFLTR